MALSLSVPRDAEGYVQSFVDPQDAKAVDFYEKYGFVVIADVLSNEECQRSVDEVWDYIEHEWWRRPGEPCFMGYLRSEVRIYLSFTYHGIINKPFPRKPIWKYP
jgi:hypothetical protein